MPMENAIQIIEKYKDQEEHIDQLLIEQSKQHEETVRNEVASQDVTLVEATQRNKQLLKELELAKGSLRSRAIYSPGEVQWSQICNEYLKEPSLPVQSWRCHLPVYV